MRRTLLIFALAIVAAAPAGAQSLKLAFKGGRVSVDAAAVPVRTILNEWAKLGGTKIVGAEKIAGAPLTLKLDDVPESQALDIILRSVAGYMAAPRGAMPGASMYDRILVLATSSGPAPPPSRPGAANNNPNANNGTQRFVPQRPVRQEQPENDDDNEEDPNPPNPPVFTFPQPGQPGFNQPGTFNGPMMQGTMPGTAININPATGTPQTITINPNQMPMPAGPTTPFGTTGATLPGMIQQPPVQPGVRPPGGN